MTRHAQLCRSLICGFFVAALGLGGASRVAGDGGYYEDLIATESWYRMGVPSAVLATLPSAPRVALYANGELWFVCYGDSGTSLVPANPADLKAGKKAPLKTSYLGASPPVDALYDGANLWVLFEGNVVAFDSRLKPVLDLTVAEPQGLAFDGTSVYISTASAVLAVKDGALTQVVQYPAWSSFGKVLACRGRLYVVDGSYVDIFKTSGEFEDTIDAGKRVVDMAFVGYGRLAIATAQPALKIYGAAAAEMPLPAQPSRILATAGDLWIFSAQGSAIKVPLLPLVPGVYETVALASGPVVSCYDGRDVWSASEADSGLSCALRPND